MDDKTADCKAVELVNDALLWRGTVSSDYGGCFVHNRAGLDLIGSDATVLDAIEAVLDERIEPQASKGELPTGAFPGLSYVFCAYTFIGIQKDPARVKAFLQTRSRLLLREVIRCVPIAFQWTNEGYNFGMPPSLELRRYLEELATDIDQEVRAVSESVLKQLEQSEERKYRREKEVELGRQPIKDSQGRVHLPRKRRRADEGT
jgi:hypothetical protein